jgi:hypothetical protein
MDLFEAHGLISFEQAIGVRLIVALAWNALIRTTVCVPKTKLEQFAVDAPQSGFATLILSELQLARCPACFSIDQQFSSGNSVGGPNARQPAVIRSRESGV